MESTIIGNSDNVAPTVNMPWLEFNNLPGVAQALVQESQVRRGAVCGVCELVDVYQLPRYTDLSSTFTTKQLFLYNPEPTRGNG